VFEASAIEMAIADLPGDLAEYSGFSGFAGKLQ
jgi:hypothetical protein